MAGWLPADSDADAAGLRGPRATDLPPLQEVPLWLSEQQGHTRTLRHASRWASSASFSAYFLPSSFFCPPSDFSCLSCLISHVCPIFSCLSSLISPICPVLFLLSVLISPVCPVWFLLFVLSDFPCLSCLISPVCPVWFLLSVLSDFSCLSCLISPICPVWFLLQSDFSYLSCLLSPVCPVWFLLSVLSDFSCPSHTHCFISPVCLLSLVIIVKKNANLIGHVLIENRTCFSTKQDMF